MYFSTKNFKNIARIVLFRLPVLLLFILLAAATFAQQIKFSTILSSKEIGRGDYVQIEFVIENAKQIERLSPPAFPDFKIVEGPMQSSGMSIVNGNMSQYKGISFVLQPNKTGSFTIPGATAEIDGKAMKSNPVTIEVTANSTGNSGNISPLLMPSMPRDQVTEDRDYVLRPGENIVEKTKKNLFVKVQVDKNTCYVGEPIVATYKLYSRVRSESRVTKHPSLNGFSVYDMIDPSNDATSVENVNGKQFTVHIIRKAQLIPLQAGPVELSEAEVENTVHYIKSSDRAHHGSSNGLQSLLDQLTEDETGEDVQQHITLTSKPLMITVKPLPDVNKPADYNGAVGNFTMNASLENKNIAAQDAATLKITINGSGNLPIVDAPQIQWPANVNTFGTSAKENIDKTVAPMKGSKTFEYVFTPKVKGSYDIPAVSFSYFDPASNSYKTLQSQELHFDAAAAKKQSPSQALKNILSVESGKSAFDDIKSFIIQHLEWIFTGLILSVLAIYLWRHNAKTLKKEEAARKIVEEEKKKALEMAAAKPAEVVDPLLRTKRLFENGDHHGFYAELNHALWEALSNRLNLPASNLNKYNVGIQLKARGWDDEGIAQLQNMLNRCEMNLYTPDYNPADMENMLHDAEHLVKYINEV